MASNIVEILVRSRNDTKEGFDSAKADAELAGDEAGQSYSDRFAARMTEGLGSGGGGGGGLMGILSSIFSTPQGIAGAAVVVGAIAQGAATAAVAVGGLAAAFLPIAGPIMTKVTSAFDKWSGQIQKTASAKMAINAAGSAFGDLLKAMTPLVMTMMPDLTRLFNDIGKSATSGGIKTFFDWMAANAPRAFNAVALAGRDFVGAIHAMQPVISAVADSFKEFFRLLDAGFDFIGGIIDLFTGNWTAAGNKFRSVGNNLLGFVHDMVNQIENTIGKLAGDLLQLGEHAMTGLLHGIESGAGSVLSFAGHLGEDIANTIGSPFGIHFSEPSAATKMITAGMNVSRDFARGIASGRSQVGSALGSLGGVGAGGGVGGGATQIVVTAGPGMPSALLNLLRFEVRKTGGGGPNSVQRALGQVS